MVSNLRVREPDPNQRGQAVFAGVEKALERGHAVGHGGVRRRHEGGGSGPGAAQASSGTNETRRASSRCLARATAARREFRGSGGCTGGSRPPGDAGHVPAPPRSWRPRRRRRGESRAPPPARGAAGRRATTASPSIWKRAPPPCARRRRETATDPATAPRWHPAGRARGPPIRTLAGANRRVMGGAGGSGAGTKARTRSPPALVVSYLPLSPRCMASTTAIGNSEIAGGTITISYEKMK